jgi:hypothetical protein
MTTTRIIIGAVAMACGFTCAYAASIANFGMVNQVNDKLPDAEKFEHFWWYESKTRRLNDKYKLLFPEGRLLRRVRILTTLMIVCLLIAAYCLGLLSHSR